MSITFNYIFLLIYYIYYRWGLHPFIWLSVCPSICPALFWSTVNNSITVCMLWLSTVPNEVSQQARFNNAHNFGVSIPPGGENWHKKYFTVFWRFSAIISGTGQIGVGGVGGDAAGGPKGPLALCRSYKEGRRVPWTSST